MPIRQRVTLCMIVRDESSNLRACLEPVRDLFDEIVVVDTGSVDDTRSIAMELGARVVEFPWCDDFSAARNVSLEHATGDYIFWLDADDRIDTNNHAKLADLFATLDGSNQFYILSTECLPWHRSNASTIVHHPRLFLRHPEARYHCRVHEQIQPSLFALGYEPVWTDIFVTHVGYADQVHHHRKALRDLRLLKLDYAINPEDAVVLFNLGLTYMRLGDSNTALTYLLRSLKYAERAWDWVRKLYSTIVTAMCQLGRGEEALNIAAQGLANYPHDPELLLQHANMSLDGGDMIAAERSLRRLLTRPKERYIGAGLPVGGFEAEGRRSLARLYLAQQRYKDAEIVVQQLLTERPDYTFGWVTLGYVYLGLRHFQQVNFVVRQLSKCPFGEPYALCMQAEAAKAQNDLATAEACVERACQIAQEMPWPRIIRLEVLLAQRGSVDGILSAAEEVLKVNSANQFARQIIDAIHRDATRSLVSPVATVSTIAVGAQIPASA